MTRITTFLAAAISASVWLSSLAFASDGPRPVSRNSIGSVVKAYISAEEKQDYGRVYSLLGPSLREQLLRENSVTNAEDYKRLRQSSEARWFGFSETQRHVTERDAILRFNATIEESGERERVVLIVKLIAQHGKWRIDYIKY